MINKVISIKICVLVRRIERSYSRSGRNL